MVVLCEDREVAALYVVDNDSLLLPGDCFEGSQPVICEMNAASILIIDYRQLLFTQTESWKAKVPILYSSGQQSVR